ncbi:MAG: TetR/AcrR family transcriptional regulator [Myxococcota bacterium]
MATRHHTDSERRRMFEEAAIRVIARNGLAGATTRAIGEEAGLNAAMIAYTFGGKEGLLRGLLERVLASVATQLASTSHPHDNLGDAVEALTWSYWALVLETPALQKAQYELTLHFLRTPDNAPIAQAQYDGYVSIVRDQLSLSTSHAPEQLDALAGVCVALMDGVILQYLATADARRCETRLRLGLEALIHTAQHMEFAP